MSATSKTKVLIATIVILLATNIGVLTYFLFYNKPAGRGGGGREAAMINFLKKDISFSDLQLKQYDSMSNIHKEKVKAAFDSVRNSKQQLLKELGSSGFADSNMAVAAHQTALMQEQIERQMLEHFKKIRSLCTAEQLPKFDTLFYKIWNKKPEKNKK